MDKITKRPPKKPKMHPEERANIGFRVARPLFEKGPNWDFYKYRNHFLQKVD